MCVRPRRRDLARRRADPARGGRHRRAARRRAAGGLRVEQLEHRRSATSWPSSGACGIAATPTTCSPARWRRPGCSQHALAPGRTGAACAGPGRARGARRRGPDGVDDGPADAVVVGFHRDFDFDDLDRAVARGPRGRSLRRHQPRRHLPDPRRAAAGRRLARRRGRDRRRGARPRSRASRSHRRSALVRERFGDTGVVVGDRPSTDGALAAALGWPFALVLSGVTAAVAPPGGEAGARSRRRRSSPPTSAPLAPAAHRGPRA